MMMFNDDNIKTEMYILNGALIIHEELYFEQLSPWTMRHQKFIWYPTPCLDLI